MRIINTLKLALMSMGVARSNMNSVSLSLRCGLEITFIFGGIVLRFTKNFEGMMLFVFHRILKGSLMR